MALADRSVRRVKCRPRFHQEHRAKPRQNTPEGNRQIIDTMIKMNDARRKSRCWRVVTLPRHGGRIDAGFDDALEKWAEANPIFPKPPEKADAPRYLSAAGLCLHRAP